MMFSGNFSYAFQKCPQVPSRNSPEEVSRNFPRAFQYFFGVLTGHVLMLSRHFSCTFQEVSLHSFEILRKFWSFMGIPWGVPNTPVFNIFLGIPATALLHVEHSYEFLSHSRLLQDILGIWRKGMSRILLRTPAACQGFSQSETPCQKFWGFCKNLHSFFLGVFEALQEFSKYFFKFWDLQNFQEYLGLSGSFPGLSRTSWIKNLPRNTQIETYAMIYFIEKFSKNFLALSWN